ncbi:unnamed protein product [Chironomus riparius]|uniref:DUF4729 domain-containing protein n=1 Tax=Chironomus riparius TaxID=315576 RepID=A0A9N9WTP1_9DIPT|nr:unnamed protein product [Chironomus riparius]
MEEFKVPQLAMPFNCILNDCKESLTNSTIVTHFCSQHRVDFQEIALNEKILMMVTTDDNFLTYGRNVCLGIVGIRYKRQEIESMSTSSIHDIEHFPNPFPILIMCRRSNYQQLFDSGDREINKNGDFLALWLSMPKVNDHKLHSILSVFNEDYTTSISKSVDVKYMPDNNNLLGSNHLIINSGLLVKLSSDDSIILEIILKENLL